MRTSAWRTRDVAAVAGTYAVHPLVMMSLPHQTLFSSAEATSQRHVNHWSSSADFHSPKWHPAWFTFSFNDTVCFWAIYSLCHTAPILDMLHKICQKADIVLVNQEYVRIIVACPITYWDDRWPPSCYFSALAKKLAANSVSESGTWNLNSVNLSYQPTHAITCFQWNRTNLYTHLNKVMISGEWQNVTQKAVRWPCVVWGRGMCDSTSHTQAHTTILRLSGFSPGQPRWAGTRRDIHSLTPTMVISHPYLLPPSITIHGILPVQFTCLTVFFHNLSQYSVLVVRSGFTGNVVV